MLSVNLVATVDLFHLIYNFKKGLFDLIDPGVSLFDPPINSGNICLLIYTFKDTSNVEFPAHLCQLRVPELHHVLYLFL